MSNVIPFQARGAAGSSADRAVYTVKEVAHLLALNLGNTYELIRNGTIPAQRLGRRWVIPRGRFHAWLDGATDEPLDYSATDLRRRDGA